MEGGGSPSLLPMVGGVSITPVQGGGGLPGGPLVGGGECLSGKCKAYGWYSVPLLLPISVERPLTAKGKDLTALATFWKSIRSDSETLIAHIDATKSSVYIVAPLRGNVSAANDIISWAFSMMSNPDT